MLSKQPSRGADRRPQLAYSQIQTKTHDEARRRRKAIKLIEVLRHFYGRDDLSGLLALDVGASTGFTSEALRTAGCTVVGVDIDLPGLAHAQHRFGRSVHFVGADASALPLPDRSVDIVLFNHVYEHVVDADAVMRELQRVLRPDGAAMFGFANRYQIMEPHYRLPFLSWIPHRVGDLYVRVFGKADEYYERHRSRTGLLRMCLPLKVWEYTYTVLCDPERFAATDVVPRRLRRMPPAFWMAAQPIMPTFLWVGTPGERVPTGPPTRVPARRIDRSRT